MQYQSKRQRRRNRWRKKARRRAEVKREVRISIQVNTSGLSAIFERMRGTLSSLSTEIDPARSFSYLPPPSPTSDSLRLPEAEFVYGIDEIPLQRIDLGSSEDSTVHAEMTACLERLQMEQLRNLYQSGCFEPVKIASFRPKACSSCKYWHGGDGIICAVHPEGPAAESCVDWANER